MTLTCEHGIRPKTTCEICRKSPSKKIAQICPRCREPWPIEQNYDLRLCQACIDKGEVTKSKLTKKQRKELLKTLNNTR